MMIWDGERAMVSNEASQWASRNQLQLIQRAKHKKACPVTGGPPICRRHHVVGERPGNTTVHAGLDCANGARVWPGAQVGQY